MAIDELLDEHEQGERVRAWLRNNALALVGGIALGLAAIFGWKWWQQQQAQARSAEADAYSAAVEAIRTDVDTAGPLVAAVADAPYDALAALHLAKAQVDAGQSEAAIATLRGVSADDPALAQVVQLRLARLLLETGNTEGALRLVAGATQPALLELRGDAEVALGRREAAREAYLQALEGVDADSPQRRLLEIKLVAAGGTPPPVDDADAPADA